MISVESRDGRKGLGLRFGVERDMNETELEEGEACSYQKRNDDDSAIDPDVTLSYIDEKLQDVLGHFQKDFEGGVSAENLGAKFGGYGSFLPAYQQSPSWSHPRTSPKVHNHNISRSPNLLHSEGGCNGSTVPSGASLSERPGSAPITAASMSALRALSVNDSVKEDMFVSLNHTSEESHSVCVPLNKSIYPSDQKSLKVRIKVGSGNLSTQKNAEIYSGLGLDVSPSSSLDDSSIDTEGFSHEPRDAPDESPTSILQIMTSFPVHGSLPLSPLPDDLIQLNRFNFARGGRKVIGEKDPYSSEKHAFLMELNNVNGNHYDGQNGVCVILKKEADIDTLACEIFVSNALKLPLISNSYCDAVESARGTTKVVDNSRIAIKGVLKDESSSYLEEKSLEPALMNETGQVGKLNGKVGSTGKIWKSEKAYDDNLVCIRREENPREEKTDVSTEGDQTVSKGRKAFNTTLRDTPRENASQVATSSNENGVKPTTEKEHSSSMGKRRSKGSQSFGVQGARVSEDASRFDSSSVHENGKDNDTKNFMSKREKEDFKRGSGKARDRCREVFGDPELEGDNEVAAEKMPCANRVQDLEVVGKSLLEFKSMSKERPNGGKIVFPSASEMRPKEASAAEDGHISDAAENVASLVQEDWVCCDKCQTWRLLPLGTNPDSLPEKWVCSMLNWLPGKNRCSVSEEETTKALRAHYQVPAPASVGQTNLNDCPGKITSQASSIDDWHPEQDYESLVLHSVPSCGKKNHGLKDGSNATDLDGQTHTLKKNLQGSSKIGNLNGVNQFPSVDELSFQHFGQSSNLVVEKNKDKQKEKKKAIDGCYSGGDVKNTKTRNKRETDRDSSRTSKKTKIDDVHHYGENSRSDHGGPVLKVGDSSSSGFSINASEREQPKYHAISNNSNCDAKVKVSVSVKNKDNLKKRKVNECQEPQTYSVSVPRAEHHIQECRNFMEETCENDHRKEKKARASKSGGKETSGSRGSSGAGKKCRNMKDQQVRPNLKSTLSLRSMDAIESFKRDLDSVQPSVPATSSSSKVSGSHKNKSSLQEVKGSPVESVSSSPLRISNVKNFTSMRRMLEVDERVSNRSGIVRRDDTFNVTHHGSLVSSVPDFQDGDLDHVSGSKGKPQIVPHPCMPLTSHEYHDEEIENGSQYHCNGSSSKKSGKGSSSWSKDKNRISGSELDKGQVKISDSFSKSMDHTPYEEAGRNKFWEKYIINSDNVEKKIVSKKDSAGKPLTDNCKRESHSSFGGGDGFDIKLDASSQQAKQNSLLEPDNERPSKRLLSDKNDCSEVSGKGKSHSLQPSGRMQSEVVTRCPKPIPGSQKENGPNISSIDASEGSDALESLKQFKKSEIQNGNQLINSRHTVPNGQKVRDLDAPSPVRRDSFNNAIKEAKGLKHLADRLKNSGSTESTVLYFQAALKFLHGASLLESCNNDNTKHVEMIQSMQIYSSTAKLCEFCAHEYEKSKEMAAAALAYKCMEVAYMRVVCCSHVSASRDRHELQTALQIVPPGESPSSSASDVDNLNNSATVDKVALAKGVGSPQVGGNYIITAQNRSSVVRLLSFAQDVNFAMEASRKSQIAFAAANPGLEETKYRESISSVKSALDFSFQDVEGLLRLMRLAMEAISR